MPLPTKQERNASRRDDMDQEPYMVTSPLLGPILLRSLNKRDDYVAQLRDLGLVYFCSSELRSDNDDHWLHLDGVKFPKGVADLTRQPVEFYELDHGLDVRIEHIVAAWLTNI